MAAGQKSGAKPLKTTPYTYIIIQKDTGKKYYGARYAVGCHPDDLWVDYFTSSKEVHLLIEKYGEKSFDVEVRKIFSSAEDAIRWEGKFLRKINARKHSQFLNKHNNDGLIGLSGDLNPMRNYVHLATWKESAKGNKLGRKLSEEHKKAISNSLAGRIRTEEERKAISRGLKGYKHTQEFKEACRKRAIGVVPSEQSRLKKRESIMGRKKFIKDGIVKMFKPGTEPSGYVMVKTLRNKTNE